jgi:integrase
MPDLARLRSDLAAFAAAIGQPLAPWQAAALRLRKRTTVVAAPRQSGKSRVLAVLSLWWCYRQPNQHALLISAGEDASKRLLSMCATAAAASPLLGPSIIDEYAAELTLSNGSSIRSVPSSAAAIRGQSLELPAIRGRRDRVADPAEAAALIAALPAPERALWATALYAGLRRGEAMALRWDDVDFDAGVIHVRRSWDPKAGAVEVKSDAGLRDVPLIGELRKIIAEHKLASNRHGADLVFGRTATDPFIPSTVRARALAAWKAENERRVKQADDPGQVTLLKPITLHNGRHSAASYLIKAGLDLKQLTVYMGHSDVRTTINRYVKLMPGDEARAVAQLDKFLARSKAAAEATS